VANIVVDLDDTLMDFVVHAIHALNKHTSIQRDPQTLWTYDLGLLYSLPHSTIHQVMLERCVLESANWSDSQVEWNHNVWRWSAEGHQVIYCTARGWHPEAEAITTQQTCAAGEVPVKFVICDYAQSKADALAAAKIVPHIFVDDQYKHVVELSKRGAKTLLVSRPWNYMNIWGGRVLDQLDIVTSINQLLNERLD
jgi:hypothetical protein